jgi:hypothetical protein
MLWLYYNVLNWDARDETFVEQCAAIIPGTPVPTPFSHASIQIVHVLV